jgi:hypothetical protein
MTMQRTQTTAYLLAKNKSSGGRNDSRKCGKANKKRPKSNVNKGKSCCGYSFNRTDRLDHNQSHRKIATAA